MQSNETQRLVTRSNGNRFKLNVSKRDKHSDYTTSLSSKEIQTKLITFFKSNSRLYEKYHMWLNQFNAPSKSICSEGVSSHSFSFSTSPLWSNSSDGIITLNVTVLDSQGQSHFSWSHLSHIRWTLKGFEFRQT